MKYKTFGHMNCSLAQTLSVIGERWTLLILRDAFFGAKSIIKPTKIINAPNNNTVHFDIVVIIIYVIVAQLVIAALI